MGKSMEVVTHAELLSEALLLELEAPDTKPTSVQVSSCPFLFGNTADARAAALPSGFSSPITS